MKPPNLKSILNNPRKIATLTLLFIVALIVLTMLSGCITEKKRLEICKTCVTASSRVDSTGKPVVTYMPFDTTLWLNNHKGQAMRYGNCDSLISELNRNRDTLTTRKDGIKQQVTKTASGGIKFTCETDSLKAVISLLRKEVATPHYTIIKEQVESKCREVHKSTWDGFCNWFTYIVGGLLVLYLILRFGFKLKI